jgi:hypothetical protein
VNLSSQALQEVLEEIDYFENQEPKKLWYLRIAKFSLQGGVVMGN